VKLRFDASVDAFRDEFGTWLDANRPTAAEMDEQPSRSTGDVPAWARRWAGRLFAAGWLVPAWPPERGGRNAGPVETLVYLEAFATSGVPRTTNPQGLGIVAPTLFDHGSEQQIRDVAMPLLRAELSACVGMSEPEAGSDLAGLRTRAVRDGDRFVVNGQKVWTSGARHADVCLLFCRTDPDAPKHKGISVVLVDMATPGITVRPIAEIVHPDRPDLNEVFFDDVNVPVGNLVGRLNDGWALANASLAHERGMVWVGAVLRLEAVMRRLLEDAPRLTQDLSDHERAVANDRIVDHAIDTMAARCLGYRGFAKLVRGAPAPEQALMKVFSGEARQRLTRLAAELEGGSGLEVEPDTVFGIEQDDGSWLEQYFHSFANTISAGSSEIQRNIIAERVLGLPRDKGPT
jgi:alkylation response protein AidB-like acyl-CoA dehydrogenase